MKPGNEIWGFYSLQWDEFPQGWYVSQLFFFYRMASIIGNIKD